MKKRDLPQLSVVAFVGEKLKNPQLGLLYNVHHLRDEDDLVIEIHEGHNVPPDGPAEPIKIAELRVIRGGLSRSLDVLTILDAFFDDMPEMRARLSNLRTATPIPEREDG